MSTTNFEVNIFEKFKDRIYWMDKNPNSSLFSSFNTVYTNHDVLAYVSFIFRRIDLKSPKTILYVGDHTVESLITTFFLLLSKYEVYILPSDFKSGTRICEEVLRINEQYLYLAHGEIEPVLRQGSSFDNLNNKFLKDVILS